MADSEDVDTPMRSMDDEEESGSGSDSSSESEAEPVEWLATTREKRSTAGNRLTSLIQQEGEDDELELLFAEDEDDAGFEDVDDAGSDVQMDSSDDDEDQGPTAGADDLEGEQELLRQAKAEKTKKRKANDHIPKAFLKKVKVDPMAPPNSIPPRPKKKSERASWIPTAEDAPIRASMRKTTKKSKEQLYRQMVDRERRRLKQLENMEKAAKRKEADKPKEVTQEDRLAEAARIEKKNAKSLNRWEEAEKQREEEQMAKLAALHNRKLNGPVITWWSGKAEWVNGKLKHVGKIITIEEKEKVVPKKKKGDEIDEAVPESNKLQTDSASSAVETNKELPKETDTNAKATPVTENGAANDKVAEPPVGVTEPDIAKPESNGKGSAETSVDAISAPPTATKEARVNSVGDVLPPDEAQAVTVESATDASASKETENVTMELTDDQPAPDTTKDTSDATSEVKSQSRRNSTAADNIPTRPATPPEAVSSTPQVVIEPTSDELLKQTTTPPASSSSEPQHIQPQITNSEKDIPQPATTLDNKSLPKLDGSEPLPGFSSFQTQPPVQATSQPPTTTPSRTSPSTSLPPPLIQEVEGPPVIEHSTRNCVILENFSETAIRSKDVQMQVLTGRTFPKATKSKPPPGPICVISGKPARYRDPSTGLPYADINAYKALQSLKKGNCVWSGILEAYVGEKVVARGVPARFSAVPSSSSAAKPA